MSTLDRKYNSNDNWGKLLNATADNFRMQNMENTMVSLSALPRAPPAALYNPLEHGNNFRRSEDTQVNETTLFIRVQSIIIFSRESDSTTTNVR